MIEMPKTEPFPGETLIADGWVYRDLPKMTQEAFDNLHTIIGAQNTRFLTFASYPNGAVRGQLLVSPAGMERLKTYAVSRPARGDAT